MVRAAWKSVGRQFSGQDWDATAGSLGTFRSLNLVAGNYSLIISGTSVFKGKYSFRLLDAADATPFALDTTVSGTLGNAGAIVNNMYVPGAPLSGEAGQTNNYALSFSAQQVTVADAPSLSPNRITLEAWVMKDQSNPTWGTVVMKAQDSSWQNGGYGLAQFPDGTMNFFINNYVTVHVGTNIPADQWVHLAGTYDGANLKLYVNGVLVGTQAYTGNIAANSQPLLIGTGQGGFRFNGDIDDVAVWNVARSATEINADMAHSLTGNETGLVGYWTFDDRGNATIDDASANNNIGLIQGMTDPGVEEKIYSFDATVGQTLYFDRVTSGGSVVMRLYDPHGGLIVDPRGIDNLGPFVAQATGRYLLVIDGPNDATGGASYSFRINTVTNAVDTINAGDLVSGSIDITGQVHRYTINIAEAAGYLFDSQTNDGSMRYFIFDSYGNTLDNRNFQQDVGGGYYLLAPGTYYIRVQGDGDHTGAYSFRFFNPAAEATQINTDTDVVGQFSPGPETLSYKFNVNAGQILSFDQISQTSGGLNWRLFDPVNNQIFYSGFNDVGPYTFALGGTYLLVFEGYSGNPPTLDFKFRINTVTPAAPAAFTGDPITFNSPVSGAIATTGEQDDYTFTLTESKRIVFDSRTYTGLMWNLDGPLGNVITNRQFYDDSGAYSIAGLGGRHFIDLVPGDYRLRIHSEGSSTGAYSFRLLDLADAQALVPGVATNGEIATAGELEAYKITLAVGDRLFVSASSPNGNIAGFRILDPAGRTAIEQGFGNAEIGPVVVPGEYLILLYGYNYNGGPYPYYDNGLQAGRYQCHGIAQYADRRHGLRSRTAEQIYFHS